VTTSSIEGLRLAMRTAGLDYTGPIHADGMKKFLGGGRITGTFFSMADKPDGPLVICEGYATGASIFEATGFATVCAIDCGNLLAVARSLRAKWPERLPGGAADALALWSAVAHCFQAFECSPRLCVSSPEKGCGKTTLRDGAYSFLVPRPLPSENLTAAVLFRVVEKRKPVLLADEFDSWIHEKEELRGMLNSGHKRGGQALRCEGENHEVRAFNVFCPVVLSGIGELPGTLHDRSIVIRLTRAKLGELNERFDSRRTQPEQELCRKLARWCGDNKVRLEASDPVLPAGAFNRLADNWRPLFAVAEVAGGDWPTRAATAFAKLTSRDDSDAQGIGVMLLADIRSAFAENREKRMFSKALVSGLCAMTEQPWLEANRGKPITETWLARKLKSFSIVSRNLRLGTEQAKGYELEAFVDAFARYLPTEREVKRPSVPSPANIDDSPLSEASQAETVGRIKKSVSTNKDGPWDGGTDGKHGDATNGLELVGADLL